MICVSLALEKLRLALLESLSYLHPDLVFSPWQQQRCLARLLFSRLRLRLSPLLRFRRGLSQDGTNLPGRHTRLTATKVERSRWTPRLPTPARTPLGSMALVATAATYSWARTRCLLAISMSERTCKFSFIRYIKPCQQEKLTATIAKLRKRSPILTLPSSRIQTQSKVPTSTCALVASQRS